MMSWKTVWLWLLLCIRATHQTSDVLISSGDERILFTRLVKSFEELSLGRHIFPAQPETLQSLGLSILECSSLHTSKTVKASFPTDVDPCTGKPEGTHVFVEEFHKPLSMGKGAPIPGSHSFLQSVVDHAKNALRQMEDENGRGEFSNPSTAKLLWERAAPVGAWQAGKVLFPPPITIKMPSVAEAGTLGDEEPGPGAVQNRWVYHKQAELTGELGRATEALRGSRGAAEWMRSVGVEGREACLAQAGASLHVSLRGCAHAAAPPPSCALSLEYSAFFVSLPHCDAWAVAKQLRGAPAPDLLALTLHPPSPHLPSWHYSDSDILHPPRPVAPLGLEVVVRRREVAGAGFHRSIETALSVEEEEEGEEARQGAGGCGLWLLELLPHTAFADPYQISELRRLGGNDTVLVSASGVDLEASSSSLRALQTLLLSSLHAPPSSPLAPAAALASRPARLSLPVHSRYQPPSAVATRAPVHVPPPLCFALCPSGNPAEAETEEAQWSSVRIRWAEGWGGAGAAVDSEEMMAGTVEGMVVWSVPVGREQDFALVCGVTLTATVVGSLVALYVTLSSSPTTHTRAD